MSTPNHGEGDAPRNIGFPCAVTIKKAFAVGLGADGEVLVVRFGHLLLYEGHKKVDIAIHRVRGVLWPASVSPLDAIRCWRPHYDDWLDNTGFWMRHHAVGGGLARGLRFGKRIAMGMMTK